MGNPAARKLVLTQQKTCQVDKHINYDEAKKFRRNNNRTKLELEHPDYQKDDAYYQLHWSEQAAIFRFQTDNRLKYQLFNKLKIGYTVDTVK